jgi:hypothetical protein
MTGYAASVRRGPATALLVGVIAGALAKATGLLSAPEADPRGLAPIADGSLSLEDSASPPTHLCAAGSLLLDPGTCLPTPAPRAAFVLPPVSWEFVTPQSAERPDAYARYLWPVAATTGLFFNRSRALALAHGLGPNSVSLDSLQSSPVRLPALSHQASGAKVLLISQARGRALLVTSHRVARKLPEEAYLLVLANVERLAPEVALGAELEPDQLLGELGETGAGSFGLFIATYRVIGAPIAPDPSGSIAFLQDRERTLPVDPRSVLPFL